MRELHGIVLCVLVLCVGAGWVVVAIYVVESFLWKSTIYSKRKNRHVTFPPLPPRQRDLPAGLGTLTRTPSLGMIGHCGRRKEQEARVCVY